MKVGIFLLNAKYNKKKKYSKYCKSLGYLSDELSGLSRHILHSILSPVCRCYGSRLQIIILYFKCKNFEFLFVDFRGVVQRMINKMLDNQYLYGRYKKN